MDFGHTEYTDQDTGKQIILSFPTSQLTKLITDYGMHVESLTIANIKHLFPMLVGGWLDGSVNTEDLSSIANFFISVNRYEDEELTSVLLAASELSYYIRYTNARSGEPLHGFVNELRAYYTKSNSDT